MQPDVPTLFFAIYPNIKVYLSVQYCYKLHILDYETVRLYVSATGQLQALNKLRELVAVRAPLNLIGDCRQIFTQMAEQLYDRLINL